MCPLCGEPLDKRGECNVCFDCTSYIDTDELSMDELIELME